MKSPLHVVIRSDGKKIGALDSQTFLRHVGAPSHMFVADAIKHFNNYKETHGEPERASHELVAPLRSKHT
jgi:hypothetical protein